MEKRLYKSNSNKMIDGVCGGIAEYFNIDANLVRLIWVVLSLLTVVVTGVVLYLIAALLLPKKSDVYPGY